MKNIIRVALALLSATLILLGAFSVTAARYTFEEGIVPEGWTFIDREEDVKATDLLSPVNPNASREARNLYAYLCTLGDSQQFVTGQFDIATTDNIYQRVTREFGVEPALYSCRYTVDVTKPQFSGETVSNSSMDFVDIPAANALLKKHYDNGNILLLHSDSAPRSLCAGVAIANGKYITAANAIIELDKTNPDRDMQTYALWMKYMDNVVTALTELEAMGVKAYLWRPWVEFNYNDFAGTSTAGRMAFIRVFQQTVQMLIDAKLTGFLVCYSPGDSNNTIARYPGNDYVDTFSVTLYSGAGVYGHMAPTKFANYPWYVKTGKPIGLSEVSCGTSDPSLPRSSWFITLKDLIAYWPNIAWVNCWGDGSYSLSDSVGNDDGAMFLRSPFTLNLSEIPDYREGTIPTPGIAQMYTDPNGNGAYQGLEERDYTAAELAELGIDLTGVRALRLNTGYSVTFFAEDDLTGESWGYAASAKNISAATAKKFRSVRVESLPNIAVFNDAIFASDNDDNAYRANDGLPTVWEGTVADDGWLKIEYDAPQTVVRYAVKTAGFATQSEIYNVRDFALQYSDDGENWQTADTVTGNTVGTVQRNIAPVSATQFRLHITGANSSTLPADAGIARIAEFELYGLPTPEDALPEEEGLYKIDGEWVYVKDGAVQEDFSGFVKHTASNTWFYVTNGKIDWNLAGAFKHPSGIWFIVKGGQIDWGYNGFYKVNGVWFYFENGQINWNLTGLFKHPSGQWFYVQNAQINWTYTGFGKHLASNTWFYCENGSIAWSKSGAFKHPSGAWFIVSGGQINWNYTGLYKANGVWFYFRNGQLDWGYTGKAVKNGVTFNVRNGQVVF